MFSKRLVSQVTKELRKSVVKPQPEFCAVKFDRNSSSCLVRKSDSREHEHGRSDKNNRNDRRKIDKECHNFQRQNFESSGNKSRGGFYVNKKFSL